MAAEKEYDFIVVGGGTSGLVLAARLTEDPEIRVLIVEAGENHVGDPKVDVPGLWPSLIGTEANWNFNTVPQVRSVLTVYGVKLMKAQYEESLDGRIIPFPHGRLLGGSSALNAQAFIAPSEVGINFWRDLGNPGWDWETMLPYYEKSHTVNVPSQDIYAGTKERSYSASAYSAPVQNRPNLRLFTGALVEKIIFDEKCDPIVAHGVVITKDDTTQTLRAKKEVILAAGTFNSSKILEISGIGNPSILEPLGINVVIDNENVGENLQDHPMTGISFEATDDVKTLDDLARQDPQAIKATMESYQNSRSGPFSGLSINSFAVMPVVDFHSPNGQADLKHILKTSSAGQPNPGQSSVHDFVCSVISSKDKSSFVYFMYAAQSRFAASGKEPGNFITINALLSYPLSRGYAHVNSASPAAKPLIDPKYLSHPMDLEIQARHLRYIETIAATEPLASLLKPQGLRIPHFALVGSELDPAKVYVRRTMTSGWHPVGTCAMRPRADGGVVNERLVVHGTRNLRVVDASIMSLIPRGNLQSTVYAVAERAADLIKEDHGLM